MVNRIEEEVGVLPETVQQKVEILMQAGKLGAAEKLLKSAAQTYPDREEYLGLQGQFYDQVGKGAKARKVLIKAGKKYPESAPIALETARVLQKYGRYEESLVYLEKSLTMPGLSMLDKGPVLLSLYENAQRDSRLMPMTERCWEATRKMHEGEGTLYLIEAERAGKEERYEASADFYLKAIDAGFDSFEVYQQAALVTKLANEDALSLEILEDIEQLFGENPDVMQYVVFEYYSRSAWERCAALASEQADQILDPENQKWYLDIAAHAYFGMDSVDQGSAMYDRSLRIKEEPSTLNNYAWELGKRGLRLEYALELVEKSDALRSLDPTVLDTWAWVLYKMERYEDAQAKMAVALQLLRNQPDATIYRHAAAIEKALGNEDKWAEYRQKAKEVQGK